VVQFRFQDDARKQLGDRAAMPPPHAAIVLGNGKTAGLLRESATFNPGRGIT
jgi:hypothetical protein